MWASFFVVRVGCGRVLTWASLDVEDFGRGRVVFFVGKFGRR